MCKASIRLIHMSARKRGRATYVFGHVGCTAEVGPLLMLPVWIIVRDRILISNRVKESQKQAIRNLIPH